MNRRKFLVSSMVGTGAAVPVSAASSRFLSGPPLPSAAPAPDNARVAVLLVDTDRVTTPIDERIYGQFLEHINHSVEDGLFAEQVRGAGFEGEDFKTYWEPFSDRGRVEIAEVEFRTGKRAYVSKSEAAAQASDRVASSSMQDSSMTARSGP